MGHTRPRSRYHPHPPVHPHIRGAYGLYHGRKCVFSVHPHIRGAYPPQSNTKYINNGSSPHTWGIRFPFWLLFSGQRFIPTYVGHTPVFTAAAFAGRFIPTYVGHTGRTTENRRQIPVHPHIRGAYCPEVGDILETIGSSPHTWGIRLPLPGRSCSQTVHPHIRGAYVSEQGGKRMKIGSSPHTWGIRPHIGHNLHPRGSSPHTWGIRPTRGQRCRESRFIPTYVGHTIFHRPPVRKATVHPHIRGAYGGRAHHDAPHPGSSPHTWGIHWTAVRKMAGFSHFSYDFTRKSYFVQGLVFFGVIGAEAFPTHRRGRNQCLPGAHGGSVRNL